MALQPEFERSSLSQLASVLVEYSTMLSPLENIITCLHNKNRTLWQFFRGTRELGIDKTSYDSQPDFLD